MTILEYNTEVLKQIRVDQKYGMVQVRATDLREILFRVDGDAKIPIATDLLYFLFINYGIKIQGFKPEKTRLRHGYKLSIEQINALLPGSYKSEKPGARRKCPAGSSE